MKHPFVAFFFLCCITVLSAQDTTRSFRFTNIALETALDTLARAYDVRFSYNAELIQGRKVSLQIKNAEAEKAIAELTEHAGLTYESVATKYYVIKAREFHICGRILDSADRYPIMGATVTNPNKETGAISDENGYFRLDGIRSRDTLVISYLGYRKIVINSPMPQRDCREYEMFPDTEALKEVVVVEYLARGISKNSDGSVLIRPNHQDVLSGLSEPDVLQSTQLLPGIESPNETASGLYIRGGSPDQNLILWDGIKMYNSDHFFGMLSAFNPYIARDVKVYRGSAPPEYGDRVSGVLDIRTDDRVPEKIEGGAGINMINGDFNLRIPISRKAGLSVSARRSFTDFLRTPTFNSFTEKVFQNTSIRRNQEIFQPEFTNSSQKFYFADATLKAILEVSDTDKISIASLLTRNKLDYSFQDIEFDSGSRDRLAIENYGVNAKWNRKCGPGTSTEVSLYHSYYGLDYEGQEQFFDFENSSSKTNLIRELGFSLKLDWQVNKKMALASGYQFFNNDVDFMLRLDADTEQEMGDNSTHSVYQNLALSSEKSYLQAGWRSSYYSRLGKFILEPRLQAEHQISDHLRIKASAELRGQAVNQILEFTTLEFGLENQIWALANGEDIPFLRGRQFTLGALFLKNGWNFDIEGYYKAISGITSLTRGFETVADSFSEGNSRAVGLDLLLKKKWANYVTWLGYTISDTQFEFELLNMGKAFKGNNNIGHSLTWSHSYKWNRLQFSLGWKYRTGIPFTKATGISGTGDIIQITYGAINAQDLPAYHRLDLSVVHDFVRSKRTAPITYKIGFGIQNLYGQRNILSRSYGVFLPDGNVDSEFQLQEITRYSLGVTPNLIARVQF